MNSLLRTLDYQKAVARRLFIIQIFPKPTLIHGRLYRDVHVLLDRLLL